MKGIDGGVSIIHIPGIYRCVVQGLTGGSMGRCSCLTGKKGAPPIRYEAFRRGFKFIQQ